MSGEGEGVMRGFIHWRQACCIQLQNALCRVGAIPRLVLAVVVCYLLFHVLDNYQVYIARAQNAYAPAATNGASHKYPPIPNLEDLSHAFPANLSYAPCRPQIYVYPLVDALNPLHSIGKGIDDCPMLGSLAYQSEFVLYKLLIEPGEFKDLYTTENADNATHYFLPFFSACAYFSDNDMPAYAEKVFAHLDTLPYLNHARSRHIVVHSMDAVSAYFKDKAFLFDEMVQLVTNGDKRGVQPIAGRHPHWLHTIAIPSTSNPIVRAGGNVKFLPGDGGFADRVFKVMFRGILDNSSGFAYSHGIRNYIADNFASLPGWTLTKETGTRAYQKTLASSIFGLSPEGWTLDTTRTWDYLAYGVIPVVISDGIDLPFEEDLDWYRFSVRVHREDVPMLPRILAGIPPEKIHAMQQAIWNNARYCLVEQGAWHYIARQLCRMADIYEPQSLPITYPLAWKRDFWNRHGYL